MDNISPEDEVAVAFASASLYGVYLVSFALCLRWQLFAGKGWRAMWRRNRTSVVLVLVIFALTTAYVALGLYKSRTLVRATFARTEAAPKGVTPWYSVAICTIANTIALLVDSVMIYRCWVVYGRSRRVIIFPCLMWIGGLICTILQLYWQTVQTGVLGKGKWEPVNMTVGLGTVLTPFWATTILLNAYTTYMLMRRLYKAAKANVHGPDVDEAVHPFVFAGRILAESGFLYFVTTFTHFIVWFTPCNLAIRLASYMNLVTIGIAFNLVLIRVGKNRSEQTSGSESGSRSYPIVSVIQYASSSEGNVTSGYFKEQIV